MHYRRAFLMEVDINLCIACGLCAEICPLEAISMQKPDALLESRIPPCVEACPVFTNVPMYINRIKEKDEEGAYRYISEHNPFPSICGRVCHRPCEAVCRRGRFDGSLSIGELKKFISDKFSLSRSVPMTKEEKVAIIGGGPAGLSAAWSLAKMGFQPTIFEKEKKAGGWMRYGIPDYRLPKDVLDKEVNAILSMGVKINYGSALGKGFDLDSIKKRGFKAILVAVGSQKGQKLNIPGEALKGVIQGLDLLRAFNRGQAVNVRGAVAVIGGGNVAVDAARVALRLGASKVTILYRRGIEQMLADGDEVKAAQEEGIKIKCLSSPLEFRGIDGKLREIVCQNMVLGEPDESGRLKPIAVQDSTFVFPVDQAICAVGQQTDLDFWGESEARNFNRQTLETGIKGVFVAGDMVTGPATVIEAIASGQKAAFSIMQFLKGERISGEFLPLPSRETKTPYGVYDYPLREKRVCPGSLPVSRRKRSFDEVVKRYTRVEAIQEAERCWHCDLINDYPSFNEKCVLCNLCSAVCVTKAIPLSKEVIENTVRCESCPVGCQIKEGFQGACQRYINIGGTLQTVQPLVFPERETLEEMKKSYVLSTPLVTGVGAGNTYPDFKPAPIQAEENIYGIDVVTVVTEAPLTYSSILLKIDTDKPIGEEGASVKYNKRQVGHVTTEQYGSKMISLGGINLMKKEYNALLTRLMVNVANKEPFVLEVEEGAKLELQVGQVPIIDGQPADKMKIACGAAIMGIFGNQLKSLADEIIVLDYDITGIFSEGHVGQSLGFKYTGIRPPGIYASPGRYFGFPGKGWGGTTVQDPLGAIQEYDRQKIRPGMRILVLEVTGQHVAMLEADEKGIFHRIDTPDGAEEMRELIAMNSEPSLTSALYMGGCGGSARAGTTENPVKLNRAVHDGRIKLSVGGVPAYVLPGGGINFVVDVGRMKWRTFSWVAVPAVVAPVEYTMEKGTFIEMGGHKQALKLLSDIKAAEASKWKHRNTKS